MKILVLGAGGMLGHKMCQILQNSGFEVWAAFHKPVAHYSRYRFFNLSQSIGGFDATNEQSVFKILDEVKPDAVVNCIGVTTRKLNQNNAVRTIQLNALLPHLIEQWVERHQSRLIHFSTDCVFSGSAGPYSEANTPDASDLYGKSKALGEVAGPRSLTIRSSIIGLELENRTELIEWFLSQHGQSIRGYRRALYTGVTTNFMAKTVAKILRQHRDLNGVYQLASDSISKLDLLKLANDVFENECEIAPNEDHPVDKRLDGSRFRAQTGIQTPSWASMLEELAVDNELYTEWRAI